MKHNWETIPYYDAHKARKLFVTSPTCFVLTLFRMKGQKASPLPHTTSFLSVTSTNLGISPENFQTLKTIPSTSPKSLNLNQRTPQNIWCFWSNVYKIMVMITSLIRMLESPKRWSHNYIYNIIWITLWKFIGDVMDILYDFISKYLYFKKG